MVRAMIGRFLVGFLLMMTAFAPAANAQSQSPYITHRAVAVVELYTSQGCTQCPRANRLLGTFMQDENVLALTFPVGIWDYLGWEDTLAQPEFTERQRSFSRALRLRGRFTPQLVINGAINASASYWDEARATLDDSKTLSLSEPEVTITHLRGNRLRIAIGPGTQRAADIWMVSFEPGPVSVYITGGLNLNRRIYHFNLVRDLDLIGRRTGEPVYIERERCTPQCAVIVQEPNGGRIVAAAYTSLRRLH